MATVNYPDVIYGLSSTNAYNVRSFNSEFGDGYQSVIPDGINHIWRNGVLSHPIIDVAAASSLRAFLKQHVGTGQVVTIKDCFEDNTGDTTLNVYLSSWSESYSGGGTLISLSVSFREAFNE